MKNIIKKTVSFALVVSALSLNILAVDSAPEKVTFDSVLGGNANSNNSASFDANEFYKLVDNLDTATFGKLKWDVPSSDANVKLLNVEFEALQHSFANDGYGEKVKLDTPVFSEGYSNNIIQEFGKTFGDLSVNYTDLNKFPDGWDMSSIMSAASDARKSTMSGFTDSQIYKSTVDNISIGNVFKKASQQFTMPPLENSSNLNNRVNNAHSASDANVKKMFSESKKMMPTSEYSYDFTDLENAFSANVDSAKQDVIDRNGTDNIGEYYRKIILPKAWTSGSLE